MRKKQLNYKSSECIWCKRVIERTDEEKAMLLLNDLDGSARRNNKCDDIRAPFFHTQTPKKRTKNIHKSNHLKIYVKQAICCNTCQWPRQPERMRSLPLLHSILSHSRFFFSPSRIYMTSVCYRNPFQSHSKCPTDENLFLDNVRAE